jgi:antibiotic biosynthesis monooxygenase (ABM) superfamily enzyme
LISCHVTYEIDPSKILEFETYAKMWIPLVRKFGGLHHGYFLPSEGKNFEAFAIFSFESLSAYENYRVASLKDEECLKAFRFAEEHRIVLKVERQFMRPVLD